MFLKSLKISTQNQVIREINFRNGINLIVDETPSSNKKTTGNNVGKTTTLMLVDFCLGSSGKDIYTDPENKKEEYKLVKSFLIDKKVIIALTLKEDLSNKISREICLERNFLPRRDAVRRFNGVNKTEDEFDRELTNLLFQNHDGKKPTFRQIIAHNIRYKDLSINNTLRVLDAFTRDDEYETLYLFLLGCNFEQGDLKQDLLMRIRLEQTFKARLEREQTRSAYETSISLLEGDIEKANRRKANLNLNETLEADLQDLNNIRFKINYSSSETGKLKIRRNLILEAKNELSATVSNVDSQQLRSIYNQAKEKVAGIQKTFEDLIQFHNQMITNKIKYILQDLPKLDRDIAAKDQELSRLFEEEKRLALVVSRSDSFKDLENIITELNELHRRKGEYQNIVNQLMESESSLSELNGQLKEIDDALFSDEFERKIKVQLDKFNIHFATISQKLYGEKYALKVDPTLNKKGQRLYKFSAFNTNFSSGKKQGEISCFDIAYTLFADEQKIPCFHFLLNDKKELMHDNQLLKIGELVNQKGIQFVASILKDKLPEELNREEYIILKLSQTDKLFRIENAAPQAAL